MQEHPLTADPHIDNNHSSTKYQKLVLSFMFRRTVKAKGKSGLLSHIIFIDSEGCYLAYLSYPNLVIIEK